MLPYLIVGIVGVLFATLDLFKLSRGLKHFCFFLLFIFLAMFVGVRDQIGFDWNNYAEIYDHAKSGTDSGHLVEFGYLWLNEIFAKLHFSFNSLVLFVAIVSLGLKFFFIGKTFDFIFVPMLFYLAYYLIEYEMSGMRQSVAMGFGMISLIWVRNKHFLRFLFCIILGAMFHISILFFWPIYFLNKINFSFSTYAIILAAGLFLVFFNLMDFLLGLATSVPLGSFIMQKINSYTRVSSAAGFTIGHAIYVAFAILFIYYKRIVNDSFYNTLLNGFIVGIFFSLIFSGSLSVLNRLTYYYLMLGGFLFAYVLAYTRSRANKLVLFAAVSFFFLVKIAESVYAPDAQKYYRPYTTFLDKD